MPKSYSVRQPGLAFASGVLVGSLGGLIGLGGAEFRLPLLLTLFDLYPHRAVRFNLLVSFITLAFAALTRLQFGIELHAHFDIVLSMIGGGIVAAWIGARLLSAVSANRLIAIISRLMRASMIEVMRADFIRTARAKGLTRARVVLGHALPNAILPVIAMIGIDIGIFMGGIVVVESVFGWPGIGQLAWQAIQRVDIPIIMGVTLVSAFAIVLGNLLADLVAPFIDPRIKLK